MAGREGDNRGRDSLMASWFNGHEFKQGQGDGGGQGGLACCSPWGRKEWDMTEWLNNNKNENTAWPTYAVAGQYLWENLYLKKKKYVHE